MHYTLNANDKHMSYRLITCLFFYYRLSDIDRTIINVEDSLCIYTRIHFLISAIIFGYVTFVYGVYLKGILWSKP